MNAGRWLTVAGVSAVGTGVAMMAYPGVAGLVGVGNLAVTLLGVLSLVAGVHLARARLDHPPVVADPPPVVEGESLAPTAGASFDAALARSAGRRFGGRNRRGVHQELRETAVEVVAWRTNCTREATETRVEEGTWTDDSVAAAFLAGPPVQPSALDRVRRLVGRETTFQRRARRTADALAALADVGASGRDGEGRR